MGVPRLVVSAAIAALALMPAACGSGGSNVAEVADNVVPAGKWVHTVCGTLRRYDSATKQPFLVFQGLHLQFKYGVPKRSDVRDKQIAASESIVTATDHLITELEAAGAPNTAHGSAFEDELVSAFHELRDSIDNVHDEATSLPTGSGRAGPASELSPEIGSALQQLAHRIDADRATNGAGLDIRCGSA
jgi:hypothetical protein